MKRTSAWLLAALISASNAAADSRGGAELRVRTVLGQPKLHVEYSLAKPLVEIEYGTTLTDDEIAAAPMMLDAAFMNLRDGTAESQFFLYDREALGDGYFVTSDPAEVKAIVGNLRALGLLFTSSEENGRREALYRLELGSFCDAYPDAFVDTDAGTRGCPAGAR